MTNYTDVFSGNPIQPSMVGYKAVTLTYSLTLSWPSSNEDNANIVAQIMAVDSSFAPNINMYMPPANQASVGMGAVFINTGSYTYTVEDNQGNGIVSLAPGNAVYVYLTDNSTVSGQWASFALGLGASSPAVGTLAGNGLAAIATSLNLSHPVSTKNSNYTVGYNDRAQTIVSTGGAVTFSFTAAATLGNNWFALIKNSGTGALTLDPNAAELIDGAATASLAPNDACFVICSGAAFYTVGLGKSITSTITRLSKSVAGSADVTLTATEAGYTIIELTGALTGNINLIMPTAVNRWYIYNATSGAFSLTVKTAAGTGVIVPQGTRTILHCDATNIVTTVNSQVGTVTSVATGTGLTGGPISTTGTVALANTTVTAGTYGGPTSIPTLAIDAQGRITAASGNTVGYAPLASPALTGTPTAPTASAGTNTTQLATTAFVAASYAPLNGPALTGSPTAPTAGLDTGNTAIATTAFVLNQSASKADQAAGTSTTRFVSPAHAQDHSSAAKAWVNFNGSSGAINDSYGVSGVVRNATGDYTITFSTAFATANYAVCGAVQRPATNNDINWLIKQGVAPTTTTIEIVTVQPSTATLIDANIVTLTFFGKQ